MGLLRYQLSANPKSLQPEPQNPFLDVLEPFSAAEVTPEKRKVLLKLRTGSDLMLMPFSPTGESSNCLESQFACES